MPDLPDQLYAAFVLAEAPANSVILAVDPSKALVCIKIIMINHSLILSSKRK